jgi:hypothetical protein
MFKILVSFLLCGLLVPAVVAASNVTDLATFISGTNGYRVIGAENSLAGRMIATLVQNLVISTMMVMTIL